MAEVQFNPYNVNIDSVSPSIIKTDTKTTVKVKVENKGVGGQFYMNITDYPSGWDVTLETDGFEFIDGGDDKKFSVSIETNGSQGDYELEVEVFAVQGYLQYPAGDGSVDIEVMAPPGDFYITSPTQNEVVDQDFFIQWTVSNRADTYDLSMAKFVGGIPEDPPSLIVPDLNSINYQVSFASLERGATYEVNLVAKNAVGESDNTDGARIFSAKPYDFVGEFYATAPTQNQQVVSSPAFSWLASANAWKYDLNVLPEVGGQPSNDGAIIISDLTTTFYQWQYAPLEGGQAYYYSIRAYGEGPDNSRLNEQGLVRFLVSGIDDFSLIQPAVNQEKVTLNPEFRWLTAEGAQEYYFELYGLPETGPQYHFHSTTIAQVPGFISYTLPNSLTLSRNETYIWRVTALRNEEEKENNDGPRIFKTTQLQPFNLANPKSYQPDVTPIPTFVWEESITAESYTVEVAERLPNGEPDDTTTKYSAPLTDTSWLWSYIPLERGKQYLWRVQATDGVSTIYSAGDYQPFTVMPLVPFDLLSPADLSTDIQIQPILQWEEVELATGYNVHLLVDGEWYTFLEVPANQHAVDLIDYDLTLAGNTTYIWSVEALAEDVSLFTSYAWSFTTRAREVVTSCDVIDFLTKRQYFSDDDMTKFGIITTPIDASTYIIRTLVDDDHCER